MNELNNILKNAGMMEAYAPESGPDGQVAVSIMAQSCATIMRLQAEGLAHVAMQDSGDSSDFDDERIADVSFNRSGTVDVKIVVQDHAGEHTLNVLVDGSGVEANW